LPPQRSLVHESRNDSRRRAFVVDAKWNGPRDGYSSLISIRRTQTPDVDRDRGRGSNRRPDAQDSAQVSAANELASHGQTIITQTHIPPLRLHGRERPASFRNDRWQTLLRIEAISIATKSGSRWCWSDVCVTLLFQNVKVAEFAPLSCDQRQSPRWVGPEGDTELFAQALSRWRKVNKRKIYGVMTAGPRKRAD